MDGGVEEVRAVRAPRRSRLIPVFVGLLTGLTVVIVSGLAGALRPAGMSVPTPSGSANPTPPASFQHPLVGAWRCVTDEGDPFLYTFFADGNVQGATLFPTVGPAHGTWTATGERKAMLMVNFLRPSPPVSAGPGAGMRTDPVGFGANLITIHLDVELDLGGDHFTAGFSREEVDATGMVLERSDGTLVGNRIDSVPTVTPIA